MGKYVIISPVRNEEEYVRLTIESILAQTLLPKQWIIVNDGSTDSTAEIINGYLKQYTWIKMISLSDRGFYYPGAGVVNVFNQGYTQIDVEDWEFIVKLDVDLEFEPDYFESLLNRFKKNTKLGMASGCCLLLKKQRWVAENVQDDHPVGPSKVYQRQCYEKIGGLKPLPGWDLADVLASQMNGYQTVCFKDLHIKHYRVTGSRRKGIWAPKHLQGRFEYRHGYAFWYTFLKALRGIRGKPLVIGCFAKVFGYLYAAITKEEYLFDAEMRKFLRAKHKKFIVQMLK